MLSNNNWCLLLPWAVVHGTCICNSKAALEQEDTFTFAMLVSVIDLKKYNCSVKVTTKKG